MTHAPVLFREVLQYLDPKPNENFIDCTVGQGGHAVAILEKNGPNGKVFGIDLDPQQIENCKLKIENYKNKNRIILVNDSYVNLKEIVEKNNFFPVHGILLDLGMSSWQLEESGRGFTFLKDEPLDMRYAHKIPNSKSQIPNKSKIQNSKFKNELTAERIVNEWSEKKIEGIFREYGEERFSKRITKEIIEARKIKPIKTTFQLVEIIKKAIPAKYRHQKIHYATRTFQALRIAVNSELENLKEVLPQTLEILNKGGRLVIISFHSLEDRIVKNFFKEQENLGKLEIVTKKPITASSQEIKLNPRARSAKLRAAIIMEHET